MFNTISWKKHIVLRMIPVLLSALIVTIAAPVFTFAAEGDSDDLIVMQITVKENGLIHDLDTYYVGDEVDYTGLKVVAKCVTEAYIEAAIKDEIILESDVAAGDYSKMLKSAYQGVYWNSAIFTYDNDHNTAFNWLFEISPAQGTKLAVADNNTHFVVSSKANDCIYGKGGMFELQGLAQRDAAVLIDSTSNAYSDTADYIYVINGYALTHKTSDKAVKVNGTTLDGVVLGTKATISGRYVENYTEDMLWKFDNGNLYFYDEDEEENVYLGFDGKKSFGDCYDGKIAGTFLTDDAAEACFFEFDYCGVDSLANNCTTLWGYAVDGNGNIFTLECDDNGSFYGKYRTATQYVNAGTQLWPAANVKGNLGIYILEPANIKNVTIVKEPDKMVYKEGDLFDPTGMEIEIAYSNGDSEAFSYYEAVALADMMGFTVDIEPDKGVILDADDSGKAITVTFDSYSAYSETKLMVLSSEEHLPGDINNDGAVNSKDLTRLMKYISGENVEVVAGAIDVNGDGNVNGKDLTRLMKYLAGEAVEIC